MSKVEESVWSCIQPKVEELGLRIYDVEYVKEGMNWYLRVFIDKDDGVSIEDCENVSRAIDPLLDELNPIKTAYSLEVSSPGIERVLRRDEHFKKYIGSNVEVSLFKPIKDAKKIECILKDISDNEITVNYENNDIKIDRKNISLVKTIYEF